MKWQSCALCPALKLKFLAAWIQIIEGFEQRSLTLHTSFKGTSVTIHLFCHRQGATVLPHFVPPSKALPLPFKHIYNKCDHAPLHGGAWSSVVTASLDLSHFLPLNRVLAMTALSWDNKGPHSQNYLSTPDHICLYWLGVEETWVGSHLHVLHMHMCASYRESL